MSKKTNPEFCERHCSAEDLEEAKKKRRILRPHGGKNAIEVMREYIAAKKSGNKPVRSTVPLLGIRGMLDIPDGTTLTLEIDGINNIARGRALRKVAAAAKVAVK
jgi:hypothetical protein